MQFSWLINTVGVCAERKFWYLNDCVFLLRVKSGLAPLLSKVSARKSELTKFENSIATKKSELRNYQNQIEKVASNLR